MTKTINRVPVSVNAPEIEYQFFNHNEWKGVNTNKNFLAVDQYTFESANNVYITDTGLLRSRPSIKHFGELIIDNILNMWTFPNVDVFLTFSNEVYQLHFLRNILEPASVVDIKTDNIKLVLVDEKIFVFLTTDLYYYDNSSNAESRWHSATDLIYVPTTQRYIKGNYEDGESDNILTTSHYIQYVFDSLNDADIAILNNKTVSITINNEDYTFVFNENSKYTLVELLTNLFDSSIDTLEIIYGKSIKFKPKPVISISKIRGNMIIGVLNSDKNAVINILYSADGISFTSIEVENILGAPVISEDGMFIAVMKDDGLYIKSVIQDTDGVYKYPEWTNVLNNEDYTGYKIELVKQCTMDIHCISYDYFGYTYLSDSSSYRTLYSIENTVYQTGVSVNQQNYVSERLNESFMPVSGDPYIGVIYVDELILNTLWNTFIVRLTITAAPQTDYVNVFADVYLPGEGTPSLSTDVDIPINESEKTLNIDVHGQNIILNISDISIKWNGSIVADGTMNALIQVIDGNRAASDTTEYKPKLKITTNGAFAIAYSTKYSETNLDGSMSVVMSTEYFGMNKDSEPIRYKIPFRDINYGGSVAYDSDIFIHIDPVTDINTHYFVRQLSKGEQPNLISLYTIRSDNSVSAKFIGNRTDNALTIRMLDNNTILTDIALYNNDSLVELLFTAIPICITNNKRLYLYNDYKLYSTSNNKIELNEFVQGVNKYILPSHATELEDFYFSVDKNLYISEYPNSEEFKWYFPKIKHEWWDDSITNLHPISKTEVAIFFKNSIYYVTNSENVYYYTKSKLGVGCNEGSDVITTFDGTTIIFSSSRGLVAMSYQDFIASSEQSLTYLSDTISPLYRKFNTGAVKLYLYEHWLIVYKSHEQNSFVFDLRNDSWWPMTYNGSVQKILTMFEQPILLDNKLLSHFDTSDNKYSDDVGKINWHITSQKLHLNAINYNKHIISFTLATVNVNPNPCSIYLNVKNYRKRLDMGKEELISYEVDIIRTFVKRVNYSKVAEFQYTLSSNIKTYLQVPFSISNIAIKYNITGALR